MGVHIHGGTMSGCVTPLCNECGIALCWDVSDEEYEDDKPFWDEWICMDCNGGERLSLDAWKKANQGRAGGKEGV